MFQLYSNPDIGYRGNSSIEPQFNDRFQSRKKMIEGFSSSHFQDNNTVVYSQQRYNEL